MRRIADPWTAHQINGFIFPRPAKELTLSQPEEQIPRQRFQNMFLVTICSVRGIVNAVGQCIHVDYPSDIFCTREYKQYGEVYMLLANAISNTSVSDMYKTILV